MAYAAVTDQALAPERARDLVRGDADGALVVFEGVVRDHDHGRGVTALTYSAHPDATAVLRRIADRVQAEFGVSVGVWHRVGDLVVGDVALLAACASAHRADAFAACGALVDRVKAELPVWKHQRFVGGDEEWVGL